MVVLAPSVCAIDIDIREFTLVSLSPPALSLQTHSMERAGATAMQYDVVLIEVASPICYHGDSKAASVSVARWQIWNAMAAGILCEALQNLSPAITVLVSPSSKWTMGYSEKDRHAMAGIKPIKTKSNGVEVFEHNHDIRECMAMLWSYSVKPGLWVPMSQYLEEL